MYYPSKQEPVRFGHGSWLADRKAPFFCAQDKQVARSIRAWVVVIASAEKLEKNPWRWSAPAPYVAFYRRISRSPFDSGMGHGWRPEKATNFLRAKDPWRWSAPAPYTASCIPRYILGRDMLSLLKYYGGGHPGLGIDSGCSSRPCITYGAGSIFGHCEFNQPCIRLRQSRLARYKKGRAHADARPQPESNGLPAVSHGISILRGCGPPPGVFRYWVQSWMDTNEPVDIQKASLKLSEFQKGERNLKKEIKKELPAQCSKPLFDPKTARRTTSFTLSTR
ncbi:hypothetical protein C8R47DRAFT_1070540 [Mycena vitilis]|nr:hypothetical protein C8R47DRAFT_1070540 [Mycena vitilis]